MDCGILVKQDEDELLDFEAVYDFEEYFERRYPWSVPAELRS